LYTREALEVLVRTQPQQVIDIVLGMQERLSKDSHNSSKPPSQDGLKKIPRTRSLRGVSGKKPGGQKGHEGSRLEPVEDPDHIMRYPVEACQGCGHDLNPQAPDSVERRQVFDLPPLDPVVTEHQGDVKVCPRCGRENRATFPKNVTQVTQYGSGVNALAIYCTQWQLLPLDRTASLFDELFGLPLGTGTLCDMIQRAHVSLEDVEVRIRDQIRRSAIVNFDESGVRCQKKLGWVHSASTPKLTTYHFDSKRGNEAMNTMGILPTFQGRAIHDHLNAYFLYACRHGLCNAHHLRELVFIAEQYHEDWAQKMMVCLRGMLGAVEEAKACGRSALSSEELRLWQKRYDALLKQAQQYHAALPALPAHNGRGRKKQRPGKNLLDRLDRDQEAVLAFLYDFTVPFTNNLAERDIRMAKLKQKISGCFRSLLGAQAFCRIRGSLSTAHKQGWNIFQALQSAAIGSPWIPSQNLPA
jgi:transposase